MLETLVKQGGRDAEKETQPGADPGQAPRGRSGPGQGSDSRSGAVRQIAVTEQTYYRWRNEYGGLSIDQARRLKQLEQENARLKRAVADLTLDKLILKEAAEGNF